MIVTKTVYLIAIPVNEYDFQTEEYGNKINYMVYPYSTYSEHESVASMQISFEVPDSLDPTQLRLKALESEKTRITGDFQARITEIQRQINECLAIEG